MAYLLLITYKLKHKAPPPHTQSMYPHWRSLLPHFTLSQRWLIGSFSFGFLRGMGAEKPDLITLKALSSSYNGVLYTLPPIALYGAVSLIARMEIALMKKDPTLFPSMYREWNGETNKNVFF